MDEEKKEDRNCIECKRGGEGGAEKKTGEEIKWWMNNKDGKIYNQRNQRKRSVNNEKLQKIKETELMKAKF